jgi:hypothetical protein
MPSKGPFIPGVVREQIEKASYVLLYSKREGKGTRNNLSF